MAGVKRERARDTQIGYQRWLRYTHALGHIEDCIRQGYYLQALAFLDSLIIDRLASRVGFLTGEEPDVSAIGALCHALIGPPGATDGLGIEQDPAFRAAVHDVWEWSDKPNDAIHGIVEILRSHDPDRPFDSVFEMHRATALQGVEVLQRLDQFDTHKRELVNKIPANGPDAFFSDRRVRMSRMASVAERNDGDTTRAEVDLSAERLRLMLARAVHETYAQDGHLIDSDVREEALVFRIAHRLANWIEEPEGLIRVDVEYNRRSFGEDFKPKREVSGYSHVTPDLIVHCRGNDNENLLVVEARKSLDVSLERQRLIKRLVGFQRNLGYKSAVLLELSTTPKWQWIDSCEASTTAPNLAELEKVPQSCSCSGYSG